MNLRFSQLYALAFFSILFSANCFGQLTEGLLINYSLDGNYLDNSGNGYHGTPFNATFTEDSEGNPDAALEANGVNTYVQFPNIPELEVDFPFTMAVRARFDALDGTQILVATDYGVNTHSGAWIQINSNGTLGAAFGNGQGGFNASTIHRRWVSYPFELDEWYSIVAVYRGHDDIDIYVDCEEIGGGGYLGSAQTIGYTEASGNLCRKRGNPESVIPPYYFDGGIDEFSYWSRELVVEEILTVCSDGVQILDCSVTGECFATTVDYVQGTTLDGGSIDLNRTDEYNALGEPEGVDELVFTSLGYGGSMTFQFDGAVPNLDGDDIQVVETSYNTPGCEAYPEYADVSVSQDGLNWFFIGTVCKADPFVDISDADVELECVSYIKVTSNDDLTSTPDAYDIDGVVALHNCDSDEGDDGDNFVQSTDLLNSVLNIYPNPSSDSNVNISFQSKTRAFATVDLYDLNGKHLKSYYRAQVDRSVLNNSKIDISGLEKGVYILHLQLGSERISEKLVVL